MRSEASRAVAAAVLSAWAKAAACVSTIQMPISIVLTTPMMTIETRSSMSVKPSSRDRRLPGLMA